MAFDEVFFEFIPANSPTMNNTNTKCTAHLVSQPYDQRPTMAKCYGMPIATTVSPCTSEVSDTSAATMSITGGFIDIEQKYHVDARVLGTGHHGSVRECTDRTTGQRYAVKSICKSGPAVKRSGLAREIMLLQEMKHHSIVQLIDVFEDADYVHLVTDLYEGGELFDKITEKTSIDNGTPCFSEEEAAKTIHQILKAVSYMHQKGIVHRDIKPENILFESKNEDSPVKIIDFGLSRKHSGSPYEPPMSTIVGTPYYIAPEVLRKQYDKSCDLWSVGVIAYILLCGYPPFSGGDNSATHRSILRGQFRFPSQEWKFTSQESRDFIRQLLQIDPRQRMTVEQALHHPWMVKHVSDNKCVAEKMFQYNPSGKAVVKGLNGSMFCGLKSKRMRIFS